VTVVCPHGDPTCPCPDGDSCHYEGTDAFTCPNRPWPVHTEMIDGIEVRFDLHCHIEGCDWENRGCGLSRLGRETSGVRPPIGSIDWMCGADRAVAALEAEGLFD
jgi:hypothetical protein